ncbi:hypothetical protein BRD00_13855 [Halobacteriales archaeon QS_8_69_26]|nr:MAG: hypothetical protein BRD00_13855 [Halobacteriales archaeon QS_8_69_26]
MASSVVVVVSVPPSVVAAAVVAPPAAVVPPPVVARASVAVGSAGGEAVGVPAESDTGPLQPARRVSTATAITRLLCTFSGYDRSKITLSAGQPPGANRPPSDRSSSVGGTWSLELTAPARPGGRSRTARRRRV